jgi:hypothetical protein
MATYAELAPTLQKAGITRTSLEADIAAEKEKKDAQKPSKELPTETKARVAIVKDCYLIDGIEKSNGLLGIARKSELTVEQVKKIIAEINAVKGEWYAAQEPEELEVALKK